MPHKSILIIGTNYTSKQSIQTQGQLLFQILKKNGAKVNIVSKHRNPFKRIIETVISIFRFPSNGHLIIQVYGTKSIYIEWIACIIGKLKGCNIICTLHGGAIPEMYRTSILKRKIFNSIFKYCNIITAPSSFLIHELAPLNININKKSIIIRNCINLLNYTPNSGNNNNFSIFWMRAFHPIYNPLKALDVIRFLLAKGHTPQLHMAGPDMGLLNEAKQFIKKHHLEQYVTLYGSISNKEKQMIANNCSLYLNTTEIDNSPVSFLEMMALGLPIVTTNTGGIPYWVEDKKNALLSSNNSATDLSDLIIQLSTNSKLFSQIVQNNKEHVKQFSEEIIVKKWLTILD